jgi:hypothetical protein
VPSAGPLRQQLLALGPHAGAHRVALRAGVSVLVPLLVLYAAGRTEWSIFATFGAFTSLYGRDRVHRARWQLQARLAVYLTAAVVLGTVVGIPEARSWIAVPATAVVAALGSLASDAERWHPPGPLFLVFAFAACAAVPSTGSDVPVALAVAGASAAFAVLVGNAGAWWRGTRDVEAPPPTRRPAYAASLRWHVLPCAGGVLLAGLVSTGAGIGHPYWAMVSAVVPLVARDLRRQVVRGLHRVIGTGLGLVVAGLLLALDPPTLAVVLVVAALQVVAELLVGRNYALALVAVTPLALLMVHLAVPTPTATLLTDRGVETLLGVVAGLVVGYLTRVRHPKPEPRGRGSV